MPWYSKEQATPFETTPIEGLAFLHGDILARQYHQSWVSGKKYPVIHFPSGLARELSHTAVSGSRVTVGGAVELPRETSREDAYALALAAKNGYDVSLEGTSKLRLTNQRAGRSYRVSFDPTTHQLVNIEYLSPDAMELLDHASRAALPPLYTNEKIGLAAVAPVKFFTPTSNWTWYASEGAPIDEDGYFDTDKEKVDYLFFGLVSGFEVEAGYFSLSELEEIRGPLMLPIERDLHYEPKTLGELMDLHARGEVG